jgi:hypothetical protein
MPRLARMNFRVEVVEREVGHCPSHSCSSRNKGGSRFGHSLGC